MTILILLPTFDYSSAARQVSLLVPELRKEGIDVHIATLGVAGPLATNLALRSLGGRSISGPTTVWRLRRLINELKPSVIHAWRQPAVRAAALASLMLHQPPRLIATQIERGTKVPLLDDRLNRRFAIVDRPLAVSPPVAAPHWERPANSRIVMCAGKSTAEHGFRDAIWAFDMLKYVEPDLHLVIIGDGPERGRLQEFAARVAKEDLRVQFQAARPDVPAFLQHTDVVWVPSRANCGHQVLREAQAAGRPVIASRIPRLDSCMIDGQDGLLVPPGDPVALAAATRRLLREPGLASQLGSAGRLAVADATPDRIANAWCDVYRNSIAGP